jgi:hypothetical protein
MLQSVGFTRVEVVTPVRGSGFQTARAVAHMLRGKNSFARALRQDRAVFHAYKD